MPPKGTARSSTLWQFTQTVPALNSRMKAVREIEIPRPDAHAETERSVVRASQRRHAISEKLAAVSTGPKISSRTTRIVGFTRREHGGLHVGAGHGRRGATDENLLRPPCARMR